MKTNQSGRSGRVATIPASWSALLAVLAVWLAIGGTAAAADQEDLAEVRSLLKRGRYAAAEESARALLADAGAPADESGAGELYVEALLRNGKGAERATQAAARALASRHAMSRQAPAAQGLRWRLLGDALAEAGEYRPAVRAYQRALQLHRLDSAQIADDLEGLAQALLWLEQQQKALAAIDRAVTLRTRAGTPAAGIARALAIRGLIKQRLAHYSGARADLSRALTLQEADVDNQDVVKTLIWYSDQLLIDGDAAGARATANRAIENARRLLRSEHPDLGYALATLAISLHDDGDLDRAQTLREEALRIAEAAYGPNHPLVALPLNDLAASLIARGALAEARRLQRRALDIYERRLGRLSSYAITAVYNLGVVEYSIGDFQEAARLHRRALSSWEHTVGPNHPYVAWALLGLADALAGQQLYQPAIAAYQRALVIRERALGPNHVRVARTLTDLSASLARVGQVRRADALSQRALAIFERAAQPDGLSGVLDIRARLARDRGQFLDAKLAYERVLDLRMPLFGPNHPMVGDAKAGMAVALAALGSVREAFAVALDAERIGREHLRLTAGHLAERQALGYAEARPSGLALALSLIREQQDATSAMDAVIRGRAIVLDEMATRQHLQAWAIDSSVQPLWLALAGASQRLANLTVRGPGGLDGEHYNRLLDQTRRAKEDAEAALSARQASLREALGRRDAGLEDVRARLGPSDVLVSFVRYDRTEFVRSTSGTPRRIVTPSYVALVLRRVKSAPDVVSLGRASTLDAQIKAWRRRLMASITPDGRVHPGSERELRRLGAQLRARLWDPISPFLGEASSVFVVPDGAINLIPLAALPDGSNGYLVERTSTIHYLSAERDLVAFEAAGRTNAGLLAIGGPAYGPLPTSSSAPPRTVEASTRLAPTGRRSTCGTFDSMFFSALPASRREAEEIEALWRQAIPPTAGSDATALLLTAARAGEDTFKAHSPGHRVLHLATHGFFLGGACAEPVAATRGVSVVTTPRRKPQAAPLAASLSDNPLLLSGLAMAGANRRFAAGPNDEDGILTAEEVAALNLDGVEWAVLSACDTGLGEIRAGEGVFGLRRAFRIAGARTVIMSLWPVEDRAARAWMRALYEGRLRQKLSTIDAMRHASATVLAERRAKRLSTHPFFWAGFVAAGDWR